VGIEGSENYENTVESMTENKRVLRVALIGDRGIPARYSGFSTLVEEVSTRLVEKHGMTVTVYCRSQYFDQRPRQYKGVHLNYMHAPGGKSFESLLHSGRALAHAAFQNYDAVIVVDPGNGPLTWPLLLTRTPYAIHTDGKGWQRAKWGWLQRKYYKWSEWWSARLATWLITDSLAMREYYLSEYGADSSYLPYGSYVGDEPVAEILDELGLAPGGFHLVVARLEPENNIDYIIREYKASRARMPLVYVGGARYESEWSRRVMSESSGSIHCIGPVYESARLNGLYRHCRTYLHGHEVGGTNPSLLRAMGMGAACVPINVAYHREALGEHGLYFEKDEGGLGAIIEWLEKDDNEVERLRRLAQTRADHLFRWDAVALGYARLCVALAESGANSRDVAHAVKSGLYFPERFTSGLTTAEPQPTDKGVK
jgi:glycosyltransferase involved in cell wall biosynthesis